MPAFVEPGASRSRLCVRHSRFAAHVLTAIYRTAWSSYPHSPRVSLALPLIPLTDCAPTGNLLSIPRPSSISRLRRCILLIITRPRTRVNIYTGEADDRDMRTGKHTVRDVFCRVCHTVLGWKYVSARPDRMAADHHFAKLPYASLTPSHCSTFATRCATCHAPSTAVGFRTRSRPEVQGRSHRPRT